MQFSVVSVLLSFLLCSRLELYTYKAVKPWLASLILLYK